MQNTAYLIIRSNCTQLNYKCEYNEINNIKYYFVRIIPIRKY